MKSRIWLMMIVVICLVAVCQATTVVTLQEGLYGYAGTQDVWMGMNVATGNLGGDTRLQIRNSTTALTTSLISFNLSSLPTGMVVESATLSLYTYGAGLGECTVGASRMLRGDWVEGTGTYAARDYANGATLWYYQQQNDPLGADTLWSSRSNGANGALGSGDSVLTSQTTWSGAGDVWVDLDLTADVRGMYTGSYANNGWVLSELTNDKRGAFWSSEYTDDISLRPKLTIEYAMDGSSFDWDDLRMLVMDWLYCNDPEDISCVDKE